MSTTFARQRYVRPGCSGRWISNSCSPWSTREMAVPSSRSSALVSALSSFACHASTEKRKRRPSVWSSVAFARAVMPTGVAARWRISTIVPTVVAPGGSVGLIIVPHTSSSIPISHGVANTFTPRLPMASAVLSGVTVHVISLVAPGFSSMACHDTSRDPLDRGGRRRRHLARLDHQRRVSRHGGGVRPAAGARALGDRLLRPHLRADRVLGRRARGPCGSRARVPRWSAAHGRGAHARRAGADVRTAAGRARAARTRRWPRLRHGAGDRHARRAAPGAGPRARLPQCGHRRRLHGRAARRRAARGSPRLAFYLLCPRSDRAGRVRLGARRSAGGARRRHTARGRRRRRASRRARAGRPRVPRECVHLLGLAARAVLSRARARARRAYGGPAVHAHAPPHGRRGPRRRPPRRS